MKTTRWSKVPIRTLDREWYGRIQRAYRRRDGVLLLLHRPRSRNARWHDRIGTWAVVVDDVLVSRKHVYGRRVRAVPERWASSVVRQHRSGGKALSDATLSPISDAIEHRPVGRDELPPALTGPHLARVVPHSECVAVPTALPDVPPERTIQERYRHQVLSRAEYVLYAETRRVWTQSHPEHDVPEHQTDLNTLCMEAVLQHRIQLLMLYRDANAVKLARLYHLSWRRQQYARVNLGATRRQRLAR